MAAKEGDPRPPDPHTLGLKAWHFLKAAGAITDPGGDGQDFPLRQELDWEVELAAVIGRTCKDVPQAKALSYVAGYTIANDLGPRPRPPGQRSRRLAVQVGLDQTQDV